MINTFTEERQLVWRPVTSPHFWVINTIRRPHAAWDLPVTSPHFWVINTDNGGVSAESAPVTSPHFWVINTRHQVQQEVRHPVTSPHFWVINTKSRGAMACNEPVTSPHFWVINTAGCCRCIWRRPVTSPHFWVINTLWCIITWEWTKRLWFAYSETCSILPFHEGTDCYFCILPFCKIVCRTSRPLAFSLTYAKGLTTPFMPQRYKNHFIQQNFSSKNYQISTCEINIYTITLLTASCFAHLQ